MGVTGAARPVALLIVAAETPVADEIARTAVVTMDLKSTMVPSQRVLDNRSRQTGKTNSKKYSNTC